MVKYRNVRSGRVLERPAQDEWLEASAGWERVDDIDELKPKERKASPAKAADITPDTGEDDDERMVD